MVHLSLWRIPAKSFDWSFGFFCNAYVSKLHVVLQPLNGAPERTLVSLPGDDVQRRTSLAFSPDGRRLLIGWWGSSALLISFPEGHVQETPLDKIESIGWMPDSRRVVFTSRSEETVGLFVGDTIGGSTRLLFSSVQRLGSPSVSPDGSRVAFESFTDDHNLLEAGLDGTVARTLRATPYAEQGVDWAPSGDSYVYVQNPFRTLWIRGRENKNEPSKVSR